jgi:hypothetical protein
MPETTISIMGCLREISGRLTDAAAIAKAAVTCAESGSEHQAVRIVLELDEMLHEANTLLNGVTLLNRMWRDRAAEPEPETGFLIGPPPLVRVLATSRFTGSSWMRMPEES